VKPPAVPQPLSSLHAFAIAAPAESVRNSDVSTDEPAVSTYTISVPASVNRYQTLPPLVQPHVDVGPSCVDPTVDPVAIASPAPNEITVADARLSFGGAAMLQAPATHDAPPVHARPQAPQWLLSIVVFTQVPVHSVSAPPQRHIPLVHTWPDPHAVPHAPQLVELLIVSTQIPPHSICPPGHAHVPLEHDCPDPHARPHEPQLELSLCVFVHTPPHIMFGAVHVELHVPLTQNVPVVHALPHDPQLRLSLRTFVHAPPHTMFGAGHSDTHVPDEQLSPAPHA